MAELGTGEAEKEQRLLNNRAGLGMNWQVQRARGSHMWSGSQCGHWEITRGKEVRLREPPTKGMGRCFRFGRVQARASPAFPSKLPKTKRENVTLGNWEHNLKQLPPV